ncbi:transmembrane protein, putative [Medicago truncatula]|uniref:Transmembrane protein, putative n=1 Tax=Medicago truncatula TaxID=3880 RepID=G7L8F0_MEDTR|nr:transmembrane protein, putative [Medicago truncatula]
MDSSTSEGEGVDDSLNTMFLQLMHAIHAHGPKKKPNLKIFVGVFGAMAAAFVMGVAIGKTYKSKRM